MRWVELREIVRSRGKGFHWSANNSIYWRPGLRFSQRPKLVWHAACITFAALLRIGPLCSQSREVWLVLWQLALR